MVLAILLIVINLLITPRLVYAISPPIQTSPTNNSQVSSSKLTWEAPSYPLYSNDPYRIEVDDNSDFANVYRDYKTKNTYYTPVLTEGTWYWKIKAKDSSGTWSDWSSSWSFTLVVATPSPSLTATPSPSPTQKTKTTITTSKTPSPTPNPTTPPSTQDTTATPIPAKSKPKVNYQIASVAAATATATPAAQIFLKQKQTNYFVWAGLILIFAGIFSIGYIYFRKNASTHIKFRRRD